MNDYSRKYGPALGVTMNLIQIAWKEKFLKMFVEEFAKATPKDTLPIDLGNIPVGALAKAAVTELVEQMSDDDTRFMMASAMADAIVMAALEFRLSSHPEPMSDRLVAWGNKINAAMALDDEKKVH